MPQKRKQEKWQETSLRHQEGEAEQTAVGSIQKETSGTKEVSVFAAMKMRFWKCWNVFLQHLEGFICR